MKIKLFFILLLLAGVLNIKADANREWYLIADYKEEIPMSDVICIIKSDTTEDITIIKEDSSIHNVKRITFKNKEKAPQDNITSHVTDSIEYIITNDRVSLCGLKSDNEIKIHNSEGKLQGRYITTHNSSCFEISLKSYAPGIYIISFQNISVKLLKK